MKPSIVHDRTLALAGVFQAASLCKQLAKTGYVNERYFTASIESIFKIEASSALAVYGHPSNLKLGLSELNSLFKNNKMPKDSEIARYAFSLLHLERKLAKNSKMLADIRSGITRATNQATYFSSTHENVMANLASLYTDTLSTFSFRIYVSGEPIYLNQTATLNKIRSLLLAGIRSAVLWQQLGGRRWQLLIARSSLLEAADEWLQESETTAVS